jgi:hypothetical protein
LYLICQLFAQCAQRYKEQVGGEGAQGKVGVFYLPFHDYQQKTWKMIPYVW